MPYQVSEADREKSKLTKDEWREYTQTVWTIPNVKRADHPAVFPEEIPLRLAKLFSFVGETVLDPFAGTGTTAKAVIPIGRKVICIDQNPEYVQTMKDELGNIRRDNGWEKDILKVIQHDSRALNFIDDESVELIVTSPPYWNKADYGASSNNLGTIETYADFISSLRPAFEECYRVLAPGRKLCVVTANVNQHTDHGLLTFPLAADISMSLRDVGFVMVNEIVWSKYGSGGKWGSYGRQRPIFGSYPYPPNLLFKNVHEYILIFSKPSMKKTKGPKVKIYQDLMAGMGRH